MIPYLLTDNKHIHIQSNDIKIGVVVLYTFPLQKTSEDKTLYSYELKQYPHQQELYPLSSFFKNQAEELLVMFEHCSLFIDSCFSRV